jgi:hypothetical protein
MSLRILVTGSRDWEDRHVIEEALWEHSDDETNVLVTGACPTGADRLAEEIWAGWHFPVERHPADWTRNGKRAGFVRNVEMVAAGADYCLAFILNGSRGASMTADLAQRAGISVQRFEVTA